MRDDLVKEEMMDQEKTEGVPSEEEPTTKKTPLSAMVNSPEEEPAAMTRFLQDRKVGNLWLLSPGIECSYADHLIIGEVENERHRDAVMEAFDQRFSKRGDSFVSEKGPIWSLMDFGDVVIHLFLSQGRRLYRLEDLFPTVPLWVLSDSGHFVPKNPEDRHVPQDGELYFSVPEPKRS